MGSSASKLSERLGVSQPSVNTSAKRGEKIAKAEQLFRDSRRDENENGYRKDNEIAVLFEDH